MIPVSRPIASGCPHCGCSLATVETEHLCPVCLFDALDAADDAAAPSDSGGVGVPGSASLLPLRGYTVLGEIARGGMGIVYRARQWSPEREVALKMLLPFSAASPELRERFQLEARTLSELDHPAILPIYETGDHDGLPWFAMKLAAGGSLAEAAPGYGGRWRAIAELLATLADAVQFAHEHGVLHRDLKPGNILFDGAGRPFVADFGLAKLIRHDSAFTQSRLAMGTPHYLAPEIAASSAQHATIASDVYGLGAILFELLAGRPPFEAEGMPALVRKIAEEDLARVRGNPGADTAPIPRDLEVITLKCLAKHPAQRYASARELAEELRRWMAGEPILARPAGAGERLVRWARRRPALAAALASCVVIGMGGVAGILRQLKQTEAARAVAVQKTEAEQAQRMRAEQAAQQAARSELVMRQNLYAADMLGVQRALEQNDLGGARILLEAHRPAAGQEDLRGFEWRYFWGQTRPQSFLTLTHEGHEVSTLAFSPDGAWLAYGSRQVLLHDAATFELRARADTPSIQSLAFLPGNQGLLLGNRQQEVARWDWREGWPTPALFNTGGRFPNVAVSPQGLFATGTGTNLTDGSEGSAAIYDSFPADAAAVARRRVLPESGGVIAFSPDGRLLATGSWRGEIKLWHPETGQLAKVLPNAHRVVSLRFSPDGRSLVACSFDEGVWLYDLASGAQRPVARAHKGSVADAEISPDGRSLATGGADQTLRVWDLASGRQTALFLGHSYRVSRVAWSPDGQVLASGGQDGTVRLWRPEQLATDEKPVAGLARRDLFSADGRLVALSNAAGGVTVHELPSLKLLSGPHQAGQPVGFGPGGETLVTVQPAAGGSGVLARWAVADGRRLSETPLPGSVHALASPMLSADGRWLVAGVARGELGLWDLSAGTEMKRLTHTRLGALMALDISPDSRQVAVSFMDSTAIHLWDLSATPGHATLGRHKGYVTQLVYSADGRMLASADGDKFIKLWDLAERKEMGLLLGHREGVTSLDLSPDGRSVASTSIDRTLRLWNVATRREVARFEMATASRSVLFSPDGGALLIATQKDDRPHLTIRRAPSLAETDAPAVPSK
ncbi:MAG: protein kinase [Opitutaceae bacterium]|nr:protein kinase [Opitutaceae bacterium]